MFTVKVTIRGKVCTYDYDDWEDMKFFVAVAHEKGDDMVITCEGEPGVLTADQLLNN